MSFDYHCFVRKEAWPTALAFQNALKDIGAPIELEDVAEQPFSASKDGYGIALVFEGRPVVIEATVEQIADAKDTETVAGGIADLVQYHFEIRDHDYMLTLTFRSDGDEIRAGLYLGAAMILKFGGYGFENQFESFGSTRFAENMLFQAADAAAFED